jgi:zinc protease
MALIAVGPADAKSLVGDIERTFRDLKAPAWERPVTVPDVPYNKELLVKVVTDPELTGTTVTFYSRFENRLRGDPELRHTLVQSLVNCMMVQRLHVGPGSGATFQVTSLSFPTITRGVDLVSYSGAVSDGGLEPSVRALLTEFASASRNGFSQEELSDAVQSLSGTLSHAVRADTARSSEKRADVLEDRVLKRMPYHDRAQMLVRMLELLPAISRGEVNAWAREHDGTRGAMLFVSAPTGVAVPTETELRVWARDASRAPPPTPRERPAN